MNRRFLFFLLSLVILLSVSDLSQADPSPQAGAMVLFVHSGGAGELPFDGFHSACDGYGGQGVRYATPAGPVVIPWSDVDYILPQWEEGRTRAGAIFKSEALRPAACPDGYARKVTKKTVKVKKKEKTVEEEMRYPLHALHVIAFSSEGLENGRSALAEKGAFLDPETGTEFVQVRGGCFERGDSTGEGEENEKHVQRVCLDGFSIAKYEVTQSQWKSVMASDPSGFSACGQHCPVENVTWYDVQNFLRLLKQRTNGNYRLPTEAEWEFAARSGGKKEVWSGTSGETTIGDYAWFSGNADNRTHPVGAKKPNGIGVYDMSGNVAEWTADRYDKDYYRTGPSRNPPGPAMGDHRVSRGGSFRYGPNKVRAGFRDHDNPSTKNAVMGFRLVLEKK